MKLVKTVNRKVVFAGQSFAYTLRLTNTGPLPLLNVKVCDRLPSELVFIAAPGATFRNGMACWTRTSIAKGQSVSFKILVKADRVIARKHRVLNVATATAANAPSVKAHAWVTLVPVKAATPAPLVTG